MKYASLAWNNEIHKLRKRQAGFRIYSEEKKHPIEPQNSPLIKNPTTTH